MWLTRTAICITFIIYGSLFASQPDKLSSQNRFGLRVFQKMRPDTANALISPIGVRALLLMLLQGADGTTKSEILKALNVHDTTANNLFLEHKSLFGGADNPQQDRICGTTSSDGNVLPQLKEAYAFWVQQDFPIEPDYTNLLLNQFKTHLAQVDFWKAKPEAIEAINHWTSLETDGLIPEALSEADLPDFPPTVFVAENVLVFQSEWARMFDRNATLKMNFKGIDGDKKIKFMKRQSYFDFHETPRLFALRLPYKCGAFSFLMVMPKSDKSRYSIMKDLNEETLKKTQSSLDMKYISLSIPKFEFESSVKLKSILHELGINDLFDSKKANLSGISRDKLLFISGFLQKNIIKVSEEKTVAAAATFAIGGCGVGNPPRPKKLIVDRPFYYFIIHNKTGTVLFAGSVLKFDDKMMQAK